MDGNQRARPFRRGLVPDFLPSVRAGGFYGWPYAYFGQNQDPRQKAKRPDLVAKALVPNVAIGAHTASPLGAAVAFSVDDGARKSLPSST
jgi:glucose/arabinose dehydrogenase